MPVANAPKEEPRQGRSRRSSLLGHMLPSASSAKHAHRQDDHLPAPPCIGRSAKRHSMTAPGHAEQHASSRAGAQEMIFQEFWQVSLPDVALLMLT